ncbi:hypothetical protein Tsp_14476, partial [Trichinella spiralis]|uniref:hypothetical protein n=1 Tax=Trichinella spiralis TaxID=6334 RepID=UPI0001EFEDB6
LPILSKCKIRRTEQKQAVIICHCHHVTCLGQHSSKIVCSGRGCNAGTKITFRHPVEGEDGSYVYVEHCHQLRHVHFHTEALRHLTAVVGLIQVRDEHFRTSTAGSSITKTTSSVRKIQSHESRCQYSCPYEGSKLHFYTLPK